MPEKRTSRELREDMCQAGRAAASELIIVAKASIFSGVTDDDLVVKDDLSSEKMKIAAQAKRVAIFDGFDILDRVDKEEEKMKSEDEKVKEPKDKEEIKKERKSDFKTSEQRS
jgi:hypothetical protein